MVALPALRAETVVIYRQSSGTFAVGAEPGTPQIVCTSLGESLQRAEGLASQLHAQLWYAADGKSAPLADVRLLRRIWNEYVELPGLRLTRQQAQRLWATDAPTCALLLDGLVALKFLVRGSDGKYARGGEGPREFLPPTVGAGLGAMPHPSVH